MAGDHWDYDAGGGVFLWHSEASATISGCHVFGNTARYGGAFYLYEGAPTLRANTISSNTARDYGGGLFLYSSEAAIIANSIGSNTTDGAGGGMFTYYGDPTLSGNTISFNNAVGRGGGLYVQGGRSTFDNNVIADNEGSPGGGISMLACSPRLFHTTFARNRSWQGSGIHVVGGYGSTPALTNTILDSHTQAIYVGEGNTATLNATLWHDNGTDFTGNLIHLNDLSGDPDFGPDGYRLGANSAAIDAGVDAGVTTDIDGNRRPIGAGYDLGADERLLASYLPLVVRGYQP